LISVIVPVYKTEQYLHKCVDSLLNQTFRDFELILVDDGSPDGCGEICDEYRQKDRRVRVIHKQNGGLSDARNAGVRAAAGEYITFADSDDWAEPELLEVLMEGIRLGARVSCCGFYTVRDGRRTPWRKPAEYSVMNAEEAVSDMMYGRSIDTSAWGKLFHRSCFDEISFPVGRLYEEVATTYRLMLTQEKTAITTKPLYNYVKHGESIVTSRYSSRHKDMLQYSCEMLHYAETEKTALIPAAQRRVVYACFYLLKTMGAEYRQYPEDVEEMTRLFRQYRAPVFRDPQVSRRDKGAIILLSAGVSAFERTWSLYSHLTGRHGNA